MRIWLAVSILALGLAASWTTDRGTAAPADGGLVRIMDGGGTPTPPPKP
jgi:hypothetical protein